MTNHADSEYVFTDQENIENMAEFKCFGQTTYLKDTIKKEKKSIPGTEQRGALLEKIRKYFKTDDSPYHSKNK